ncbi:UNVERIFIED_CONTAM: hypothetical protein GTU68_064468, partial [Idotea baltica]|nr:hypothetical protein [Idotea baltica]
SELIIKKAKENNLKEIDLKIEHDSFTTITGLSGSGKSSLAFNTVYAEGQRRYIETFSPYTRQFLDKVKKPEAEFIDNVRPAIAIQQKTRINSSRSTVGSMTNINDYLKILWPKISKPFCNDCGKELKSWNSESLSNLLIESLEKDSIFLIASPFKIKKTKLKKELEYLQIIGFSRYFDTKTGEILKLEEIKKSKITDDQIIVVLDRIKSKKTLKKNIKESISQAFRLSGSICSLIEVKSKKFKIKEYNSDFLCKCNDEKLDPPKTGLFSFNNPIGACSECKGFGRILIPTEDSCIPNPGLSLQDGAIQPWSGPSHKTRQSILLKYCVSEDISIDTPWAKLSDQHRETLLHNTKGFTGIFPWLKRLERKAYKMHIRVFLSKYREAVVCPECNGSRLKKSALAYKVKESNLPDIWKTPIGKLSDWLSEAKKDLKKNKNLAKELEQLFDSIIKRLSFMNDLGLPYITLDRMARTLSGGETQRVNLAAALGSNLISTQFVLDEPSVGLHPRDNDRLIKSIKDLKNKGNTVVVVEHDPDFITSSDNIIEIGPEAGEKGGEIVFNDKSSKWKVNLHNDKISKEKFIKPSKFLKLKNVTKRNLKAFDLDIPLNRLVSLTGVSGSGKSTLVELILSRYNQSQNNIEIKSKENIIKGFNNIEQVLLVDQSPLSKTPRANIATYSKLWDFVRNKLSTTDDATNRALTKSSFSFNVDAGRCVNCSGAGFIREDMQFLSDVYMPCDVCLGKRFQSSILEVKFNGLNVDDLLNITVQGFYDKFSEYTEVKTTCESLIQLGLGHLRLGHPLSELSGGEAQRLKLVPYISKTNNQISLLIFDEPTTGLHQNDVDKLISVCKLLIKKGHSLLCVEHNLKFISQSDWLIDLGPEGGEYGGYLQLEGTPNDFIKSKKKDFHTGIFLKKYIENKKEKVSKKPKKVEKKSNFLEIKGAKEHNLKNIDVKVPLNKIVAFTGLSGSGKSSIAKDIIYAEGQRRYLDCLSPYARQYIKELKKPDLDSITNVKPTICVYQHTFQPSKLSTIATMSEVYNFLRLLYSKSAKQYCPKHPDEEIKNLDPKEIAKEIKKIKSKSIRILAPIIKLKKGEHKAVFQRAINSEINEVRIDGIFVNPAKVLEGLEKNKVHSIEFTIGKFNPKNIDLELIQDAVSQSLSIGAGNLIVINNNKDNIYSIERTCPECKKGFFKPDPEDLSFNSKRGRCHDCSGRGEIDGETCDECSGSRINEIGRNLRINNKNIYQLSSLKAKEIKKFLKNIDKDFKNKITDSVINELDSKLDSLIDLGLDYLPLTRDCATLSNGELQRLRLGTAMGSPLTGSMYIFDEPSAGLHPDDNKKIIDKLSDLKDKGNSIILIEHDIHTINKADHIIDVGPGGGSEGGEIIFNGTKNKFLKENKSITAKMINQKTFDYNQDKKKFKNYLEIKNASKNNIQNLNLKLPLNSLVTVAGVSGAGKSSLVNGIINDTLTLGDPNSKSTKWKKNKTEINSDVAIQRVITIDQKPIGKNSRSTPISYLGVFNDIRKIFASSIEAKSRGWKDSFFSYNTGKGRCSECKGAGEIKLEMNFLPDAKVLCHACNGSRFGMDAETVKYLDLSIDQVLKLTFKEAKKIFANHKKLHRVFDQACKLGLGYLSLGQSSTTLSGGESQRIKLVSELSTYRKDHILYILDEPTTGLHQADVEKLITTLKELASLDNSIILIEHDADILLNSDYIIEMGPGPADKGGKVIFQGGTKRLIKSKTPWGKILNSIT